MVASYFLFRDVMVFRAAAPEAKEMIAYQMPAFTSHGRLLVSFAAYRLHYSLFPASGAVKEALGAQGSFVALNNTVSQSVPHLHLHVVPRTKGDGLRGFFWPRTKYADPDERGAYAQRLRAALE